MSINLGTSTPGIRGDVVNMGVLTTHVLNPAALAEKATAPARVAPVLVAAPAS